jgi:hypothetical protein
MRKENNILYSQFHWMAVQIAYAGSSLLCIDYILFVMHNIATFQMPKPTNQAKMCKSLAYHIVYVQNSLWCVSLKLLLCVHKAYNTIAKKALLSLACVEDVNYTFSLASLFMWYYGSIYKRM